MLKSKLNYYKLVGRLLAKWATSLDDGEADDTHYLPSAAIL